MTATRKPRTLTPHQARIRAWILKNRGAAQRVADECGVSHQYVQRIMYGRVDGPSRERRVERALEALGCPVMRMK